MSGNLAINDAGDVLAFDGQAWKPAPVAQNDRGERVVFDGSVWRPLGAMAGAARGKQDAKSVDQGLSQAFGRGATMGFGDELTAAVRGALPQFSNWMMRQPETAFGATPDAQGRVTPTSGPSQTVSTAPTFDERYSEELARERAKAQQFHQDHPYLATAANIAGGVAPMIVAGMAGVPLAPGSAPSLGGNMLRMGATGAAYGGVQGFGEGEGGFENRVGNAVPAAAFGGAFGAAVPILGAAGKAALESKPGQWMAQNVVAPVAQRLAAVFEGAPAARSLSAAAPDGTPGVTGPLTEFAQTAQDPARAGALDRLTIALQRSGLSQDQIQRRLQQLGPEATLADIDPQLMSQARMANTMPGETRSYARNVLESRDRQAGNRIVAAFEGDQPPPSSYQLRGEGQAFDQNLRAVGNRVYGEMDQAGLKQTPELMALYENPYVKQALDQVMSVEKNARIGRPDAQPSSPVEILHKVKQTIWNMGFDEASARPGANASYFRDLGTDFVDKLKAANPALAAADRSYAQAASLPEHFDAGRAFLGRGSGEKATAASAPGLADLLAKADPQQVLAARSGATNAVRETALEGNRLARALAQRIDESTPVRNKLVELYGPQQADAIMKRATAERTFAETSNDILRGSKTADKTADILDNAGVRISEGGVSPRLIERFVDIAKRMTGPNESVRNQIGRITLTANPDENARILAQAFAQLRKRQAGNPLAAALAGRAGASLGGQ